MFVGSDTVNEFKSEDGAIHVIERRCKLDVDAPRLLKKVTGGKGVLEGTPRRQHEVTLQLLCNWMLLVNTFSLYFFFFF